MKVPKKVKAPQGHFKYVESNKEYECIEATKLHFSIIDEQGDEIRVQLHDCYFIDGQDWIVTEWQEQ